MDLVQRSIACCVLLSTLYYRAPWTNQSTELFPVYGDEVADNLIDPTPVWPEQIWRSPTKQPTNRLRSLQQQQIYLVGATYTTTTTISTRDPNWELRRERERRIAWPGVDPQKRIDNKRKGKKIGYKCLYRSGRDVRTTSPEAGANIAPS